MPNRPPSSTIAINCNAQFKPHRDSGASSPLQSMIVGLGDYVGESWLLKVKSRYTVYADGVQWLEAASLDIAIHRGAIFFSLVYTKRL